MSGGQDLYEMLGLDRAASQADIKKAYYKLALQWHPDRNPSPEATAKFQALQRVYDVLSDPEKRKVYDRTGNLQDCEEMVHGGDFQELFAAFREATRVTEQDLDGFAVKYRGSSEERADLLQLFTRFRGDMPRVFAWLMLSRPELDSHRFREALEAAVAAGEVVSTKAYKQWAAKVAASPAPSQDPLALPKKKKAKKNKSSSSKKGGGSDDDDGDDSQALVAAIQNRGASAFGSLMASLEAKYAQPGRKGKRHKAGGTGEAADKAAAGSGKQQDRQQQQKKKKRKAAAVASEEEGDDVGEGVSSGGEEEEGAAAGEPTEAEFEAARARLQARKAAASAATGAAGGGGSKPKRSKQRQANEQHQAAANGADPGVAAGQKKQQRKKGSKHGQPAAAEESREQPAAAAAAKRRKRQGA